MRRILMASIVATASLAASPALAQEVHPIVFNHGKASVTEIDAKVGDIVAFYNLDPNEAHELYTKDPAHQFDVKLIFKTGDKFELRLASAGSFEVLCHAMPHMEITINVAE